MKTARSILNKFNPFKNSGSHKTFLSSFLLGSTSLYFLTKSFNKKLSLARGPTPTNSLPNYFETVDVDAVCKQYPNLTVLRSQAVEHLMGLIRDESLSRAEFRSLSRRIIRFIIEETLALECDVEKVKKSPLGYYKTRTNPRKDEDYVGISILRAGNSMVDELLIIMPGINIGQILVQRDETTKEKKAIFYFEKIPDDLTDKKMLLLDPMLATGGSASAAIDILLSKGVKEENILFLNFVSCVEGIDIMFRKYPKMKIITSKVDPLLLPNKYIAPGLGDFGDRYYGTLKKD